MAPFPFPPESLNEWRPLDEGAADRGHLCFPTFFRPRRCVRAVKSSRSRNRRRWKSRSIHFSASIVRLGKRWLPGGDFGLSMLAFDDCLFSGFGLGFRTPSFGGSPSVRSAFLAPKRCRRTLRTNVTTTLTPGGSHKA